MNSRTEFGCVVAERQTEIKQAKMQSDSALNLLQHLKVMSLIRSANWKLENPEREELKVKVVPLPL